MKYIDKIFSLRFSLVYMLIFAIFCMGATFIENYYGSASAFTYIYHSIYFYIVQILLLACLIYCIYRHKLYEKISLFLIHISFIFIFFGAVLTHFFSFEGLIHLRADNFADEIKSTKTILRLKHGDKISQTSDINESLKLDGAALKYLDFSNEAGIKKVKSDDENDPAFLELRFNFASGFSKLELTRNTCKSLDNINFCFDSKSGGDFVNFYIKDDEFFVQTNQNIRYLNSTLTSDFKLKDGLYFLNEFSFAAINYLAHAKDALTMSGGNTQAIRAEFHFGNSAQSIVLALNESIRINNFEISWLQESLKLDYKIYLKRFNFIGYANGKSAKDYESELIIIDNHEKIDTKISMNKVLDYKGIRYFQHSYDEDLKGSIISANKDLGKLPTYFGYGLLFLGCFLNLFSKKTKSYFKALALIFCIFLTPALKANHIEQLNTIIIQDYQDRFMPYYSYALKLCKKIGCPDKSQASSEIFRLMSDIEYVNTARLIRVKNEKLQTLLNTQKYAKFSDFYEGSHYKLKDELKKTYAKGEANYDEFDKALISLDESVNIVYLIFTGELFKILPSEGSLQSPFSENLSLKNQKIANEYLSALLLAKKTNDYSKANKALAQIKNLQNMQGFLPSKLQIKAEIFIDKFDVFYNLLFTYLILFLISLFYINKKSRLIFALAFALFFMHLALIFLRALAAGFAPLTNTYESLIYIALSSLLAALILRKNLLLSLALLFSAAVLFTAHLNDINPQITNLSPVLNSPYLALHVSLITASYGFFALASLIAASDLGCIIAHKVYKNARIQIHLAILLGLLLLTCGTFLGAIWANESWGRYWGWDSKETWSLISILIYAIILHSKIHSRLLYSLLSMWSFSVILMTYFGVNFYLSGKHSYASENAASPSWLVFALIFLSLFSLLAILRNKR